MIKACVIGHPLQHSLSPDIHNYWFGAYDIKGTYEAIPVEPQNLIVVLEMLRQRFDGFNVTIPYKRAVMRFCETLDHTAQVIEAVNTVSVKAQKFLGHNTDAYGFKQNLLQKIPGFDWRKGPAVVLGAGGAAQAVIHVMKENGVVDILLANRTPDAALALANKFSCRVLDWNNRASFPNNLNLLVNTTALGMRGQPTLDMPLTRLPRDAVVYDIVYAPLMTDLLQRAQARGNRIVTGLGMLLHQAAPAFENWTSVMPVVDAKLERLILGKTS